MRNFLAGLLIIISSTGARADKATSSSAVAPERPNILVIVSDDQRYDALGIAGNPIIQTPNLDALGSQGMFFPNAYVTTSICAISRASILTGQYKSRHGINNFDKSLTREQVANTYPSLLQKAGYKTGFVGKYGVGKKPPAKTFDYWMSTGKGQPHYITKDTNGNEVHDTDRITSGALDFLAKYGKGGAPFCLSLSYKAPHEQDGKPPRYFVQTKFQHLYEDVTIPRPVTAASQYWESFPDFFRTDQNIARERWQYLFSTPDMYQQNVKDYYRLVTGVDDSVGQIVAKLKADGLFNNTAILFLGDNGFFLGEHGLEGKWFGYEESIRIPMLLSYPGLPDQVRQSRPTQMALNIDVAPTVLALAHVPAPSDMQGVDLVAQASGQIPARNEFFYEHTFLMSPKLPQVEGVVMQDLKYMKYIEHGYEELFDTAHDPHETLNLAKDPGRAAQLEVMREKYEALKEEVR